MSLVWIKDDTYMVTNDGKVLYESFYISYISKSTWYSLAPNKQATQTYRLGEINS